MYIYVNKLVCMCVEWCRFMSNSGVLYWYVYVILLLLAIFDVFLCVSSNLLRLEANDQILSRIFMLLAVLPGYF